MKTFSVGALAALERGDAIVSGSLELHSTPAIFLFGGEGTMNLPADAGTAAFKGLGDQALIRMSGGTVGGSAESLTLALSGVDPEAIRVLDASEIKGVPAVVRRLIFDVTGKTLLGSYVFTRGKVDQVNVREVIGDTATIEVVIESAARGLGRSGGRMRSDADQRLINSSDGFFKHISYAGEKTLYWGGKRPATAGGALGGVSSGYGTGGGPGDGRYLPQADRQ